MSHHTDDPDLDSALDLLLASARLEHETPCAPCREAVRGVTAVRRPRRRRIALAGGAVAGVLAVGAGTAAAAGIDVPLIGGEPAIGTMPYGGSIGAPVVEAQDTTHLTYAQTVSNGWTCRLTFQFDVEPGFEDAPSTEAARQAFATVDLKSLVPALKDENGDDLAAWLDGSPPDNPQMREDYKRLAEVDSRDPKLAAERLGIAYWNAFMDAVATSVSDDVAAQGFENDQHWGLYVPGDLVCEPPAAGDAQ
ncbi:MAG TPA: hypothetical protein PLZ93_11810 [Nocardioides sp.]|uniref:hypothetical protein n=1 Tax=uncultured Nocardioides sp. TaxID=198441 RepID=UPI002613FA5A|nr:hypothetical protein [uncultured Nocardioides sp.]HRD62418.1 hypothetical protein [Nocardioides sp.]HRI96295.1 hypothetical protein [Nocardioides sp.]